MTKAQAALVLFGIIGLVAVKAAMSLGAGSLYLNGYEIDTLHAFDVIARLAAGEVPHLDYTTAIGFLSYAPFALFVAAGDSVGASILKGQLGFAAALMPFAIWIGISRLNVVASAILLVSVVALATGFAIEFEPESRTLAGHYNRWAWALTFMVATTASVSSTMRGAAIVDGVILGVFLFALLLVKVSFFVGILPATLLSLSVNKRWPEVRIALLSGISLCLGLALFLGPEFWFRYVENLWWVARGSIRPDAGNSYFVMLTSAVLLPYYLGALGLSTLLWFHGQYRKLAVIALFLVGFTFIGSQNFGSHPLWFVFLTVLAMQWLPGWMKGNISFPMTIVHVSAGFLALSLSFAVMHGIVKSALRTPGPGDASIAALSTSLPSAGVDLSDVVVDRWKMVPAKPEAQGCGSAGYLREEITQAISDVDGSIFVVDVIAPYWLFGAGHRLDGAAPWNYGSLRGIENADLVLVPRCPYRDQYAEAISLKLESSGIDLILDRETNWFQLFRIDTSR